jgi:hypothetical protein
MSGWAILADCVFYFEEQADHALPVFIISIIKIKLFKEIDMFRGN